VRLLQSFKRGESVFLSFEKKRESKTGRLNLLCTVLN
jgi:hypothetical protein